MNTSRGRIDSSHPPLEKTASGGELIAQPSA
jgi:hypothetical protein